MARLTFSHVARLQLERLPRDRVLLLAVQRHLEQAADDPDQHTEPAPFPHRPDRLLCVFRAADTLRNEYAFSVLFARTDDVMQVTYLAFNRTDDYPPDEDE
jgi:hypothetical protein